MTRSTRAGVAALAALSALAAASCGGAPVTTGALPTPTQALPASIQGGVAQIEVRQIDARPRLSLVSRDGDPSPAVAVTVATDLGAAPTTALAAIVEARLRARGLDVDVSVDRSSFRARMLAPDLTKVAELFAAVALAESSPIAPGSPELALAATRLESLRRNPLDAAELAPVAACTGRLGVAPGEALPSLTSPSGAAEVEAWRRAALTAGRTSIAAVGPGPFCMSVAAALEQTGGWAAGPVASDVWPESDAIGAYASPELERRHARLTVALRVGDARAAVAAAERLGAADSPLLARLASLPQPWRAVEIAGVVRPRGGCVSVVVESSQASPSSVAASAALAAALVRQEIRAEIAGPSGQAVATRQILTAADPREAAARASWWALSGSVAGAPERWATALGAPAEPRGALSELAAPPRPGQPAPESALVSALRAQIGPEMDRAMAAASAGGAERRLSVERGQGEVWVLLASPCGVAEEGAFDAGLSALAALTVVTARRGDAGVAIEPWITANGVGVLAHAPFRDEREAPLELARRVADAAARTLVGTAISPDALNVARSASLEIIEESSGRRGAALDALAGALVPERPSLFAPFGVWNRVASSGLDAVRLRWQALSAGPLRVAVVANADPAQAAAAANAVDRWLLGRALTDRSCRVAAPAPGRPGKLDVRLPRGTPLAQALIGVAVPAEGAPGRELAERLALALDGSDGLLEGALSSAALAARASAKLVGGSRASALIIDVRAPEDALTASITRVRELLARLAQSGMSDADAARASAKAASRSAAALAEPRRRLVDLWLGQAPRPVGLGAPSPAGDPAAAAALRSFLASTLRDDAQVIVEARPE